MSFWGCVVAPGEQKKVETRAGELLHLSQACLAPDTPSGAHAKVMVQQGSQSYAVAVLREGGQEFCNLDLFLDSSEAKLSCKGKATVHLTGYFEAEEMDEDIDDEEVKPDKKRKAPDSAAAKAASPKATPKASPKAAPKAAPADDDEEEEEEEEEDEEPGEPKDQETQTEPPPDGWDHLKQLRGKRVGGKPEHLMNNTGRSYIQKVRSFPEMEKPGGKGLAGSPMMDKAAPKPRELIPGARTPPTSRSRELAPLSGPSSGGLRVSRELDFAATAPAGRKWGGASPFAPSFGGASGSRGLDLAVGPEPYLVQVWDSHPVGHKHPVKPELVKLGAISPRTSNPTSPLSPQPAAKQDVPDEDVPTDFLPLKVP